MGTCVKWPCGRSGGIVGPGFRKGGDECGKVRIVEENIEGSMLAGNDCREGKKQNSVIVTSI